MYSLSISPLGRATALFLLRSGGEIIAKTGEDSIQLYYFPFEGIERQDSLVVDVVALLSHGISLVDSNISSNSS